MKRIFNNLPFKILSLVLSLILWLYVTGELERGLWWRVKKVTFHEVPIRVMGLEEKGFDFEIKPEKADVVLSSYRRDVKTITGDDIILFVNLTNLVPATYEMPVEKIVPEGFNIDKIDPSKVIVTISDKYTKSLILDVFAEDQKGQPTSKQKDLVSGQESSKNLLK